MYNIRGAWASHSDRAVLIYLPGVPAANTPDLNMNRRPAQSTNTVSRLQGMNDLPEDAWRQKLGLQERLFKLLSGYGYRQLETPVLEPTELFLRKSGGELASQLYSFTDAGSNSVSLRPEFTSPIMRHYLENAADISLPARWQYCGPVFGSTSHIQRPAVSSPRWAANSSVHRI